MSEMPRVFAIEDNPADVRLIEEGVETTDLELDLQVCNTGQQAIEWLRSIDTDTPEAHPDLVLLDLNLPGKSGFDVLATIRTETPFSETPVVVVSSSQNRDDIDRAYDSAANAYVMKPADPDEYIQAIDSVIQFWIQAPPTNDRETDQ